MRLNQEAIDAVKPERRLVRKAAGIIKSGGVISFPTRCLYGLGADAFQPSAVKRIFNIKGRSLHKPILVLIAGPQDLKNLTPWISPAAAAIMDDFWPGRVTIVLKAKADLPPNLTAGTNKIGVRLPGHPVARELVKAVGGPITGTSANFSGSRGCERAEDLPTPLAEKLDLILDAGELEGGPGSTVVDVSGDGICKVLREGVVCERDILAAVHHL